MAIAGASFFADWLGSAAPLSGESDWRPVDAVRASGEPAAGDCGFAAFGGVGFAAAVFEALGALGCVADGLAISAVVFSALLPAAGDAAAVCAPVDCSDGFAAPGPGCRLAVVGGDAAEGGCAVAAELGCGLSFGGELATRFDVAGSAASGFCIPGGVGGCCGACAVAVDCADFDSVGADGAAALGFA